MNDRDMVVSLVLLGLAIVASQIYPFLHSGEESMLCHVVKIKDITSWNERHGLLLDCNGTSVGMRVHDSLPFTIGQSVYVEKYNNGNYGIDKEMTNRLCGIVVR